MAKPIIALLYDFDKTLSPTDMQEYDFIKNLGMAPKEFCEECARLKLENDMDGILAYMYVMVEQCKKKGIKLTREYLNQCGESVQLYKCVSTWFEIINKFGEDNGVTIEHYIISSGITEIIEGTEIAKYFKAVYGCSFLYDDKGEAIWPAIAINFTQKTQYIFRVSKGVLSVTDDKNLNKATSKKERRIPYENMIYIGDGITDIPCMTLIREKGGKALAIYPSGGKTKAAEQLVKEQRIDFVTVANYSEDSTLTKTIKLYIESMAVMANLKEKEEKQLAMYLKASEEER